MDLFTVDNVGETELLDRDTNENNEVQFERNIDALNEVEAKVGEEKNESDHDEEEEEDENLSDVDFGGKMSNRIQFFFSIRNYIFVFLNRFTKKHHRHFPHHQITCDRTEVGTPAEYGQILCSTGKDNEGT